MTNQQDTDIQQAVMAGIEDPEPWEAWETWLCAGSIAAGITGLIILGFIVNHFFL